MLARAGLHLPIIANHLEWWGEERWRLGFPHARGDCRASAGHCKCATLAAAPGALRVLIGDGRSDFCAAAAADLVIAKGALAVHCGNNAIPFERFTDFAGATTVLARWLAALGRPARPHSEEAAHAPTSA
jgi:2-hydroxy-3-keto-5-methylthiopentenyl-1-phosphate phosphatase